MNFPQIKRRRDDIHTGHQALERWCSLGDDYIGECETRYYYDNPSRLKTFSERGTLIWENDWFFKFFDSYRLTIQIEFDGWRKIPFPTTATDLYAILERMLPKGAKSKTRLHYNACKKQIGLLWEQVLQCITLPVIEVEDLAEVYAYDE